MAQKFWSEPSPSDWGRWEALLAKAELPAEAAASLGFTSSAFRRCDPVRHAEALAGSREARGYLADRMVDDRATERDENGVLRYREDVSDSMVQFHAKRWQPAYGQGAVVAAVEELESADPLGILTMTIEQRLVIRRRLLVEHPELAAIAAGVVEGVMVGESEAAA